MKHTLLLIDDDALWLRELEHLLGQSFQLLTASNVEDAQTLIISEETLDLVLLDLALSSSGSRPQGLTILETIQSDRPDLPVIVISAYLSQHILSLRQMGVHRFLDKSEVATGSERLISTIEEAIVDSRQPISSTDHPLTQELSDSEISRSIRESSYRKWKTLHIAGEDHYGLIKSLRGYKDDMLKRLLKRPFQNNVFLMMKFRPSNKKLARHMSSVLAKYDLNGIRADDPEWNITHDVYNPIAVLYCCKYGIALFDEGENHHQYSPNVTYELGMMHYQDKNCLILRHESLPEAPFDLIKNLHRPYKRQLEIEDIIERWMQELGIRPSQRR